MLQAADAACADQLQQQAAQRTTLATQQATIMSQLASSGHDNDARGSNATSSGSLSMRVAAAEAQVASVQTAIAARAQWAADLEQKQQLLQQQDAQCKLLQQRLAAKQAEAAGLRADLAAVKSGADAAAALQQQAHDAAAASAAVQQQQELLAAKQQEARHADSNVQFLLQEWQALAHPANQTSQQTHAHPDQATALPATTAQTDYAITSAAAAASVAATAAESHMQQLQVLQQQHMRLQMQAQAAERTLTPAATAGLLAQLGSSCSSVPLHACFRLKDAAATSLQQLEQMLTPLSVIAGPAVLQTLVAPSVSEANRLLAAAAAGARGGAGGNRRLKIWPLDNLSVHDLQRQQHAAQQQLGQHAVLLPLDLLEFEAAHRPALLRAFGGFVIAADDATAAVLVERYGLSAVTLQVCVWEVMMTRGMPCAACQPMTRQDCVLPAVYCLLCVLPAVHACVLAGNRQPDGFHDRRVGRLLWQSCMDFLGQQAPARPDTASAVSMSAAAVRGRAAGPGTTAAAGGSRGDVGGCTAAAAAAE